MAHIPCNVDLNKAKECAAFHVANDTGFHGNIHFYANGRGHEILNEKSWKLAAELAISQNSLITITFDLIIAGVSTQMGDRHQIDTTQGFVSDPKRKT